MTKEAFERAKAIDAECADLRWTIDKANEIRKNLDEYTYGPVRFVPTKALEDVSFELCKDDADALLAKIASRAACKVLLLSEEFSRL